MQEVSVSFLEDDKFAERAHDEMKKIDIDDKLLVFGYFRKEALTEYGLNIPSEIINFCIIYLFSLTEKLYIGNMHQYLPDRQRSKHRWTMFISTSKSKLVKPKTIRHVTYYLHPTFRPPEVKVSKSPFYLERRGWGTFTVNAKITFKTKCRRKKIDCSHNLNFGHHVVLTSIENEDDHMYFHNEDDYPMK